MNDKNENAVVGKQLFLISCGIDNDIMNYIDLLNEIGEYKIFFNPKSQIICLNSDKEFSAVKEELYLKTEKDKSLAIVSLTLPMIDSMQDEDVKSWCLKKISENIVSQLSKESFDNANMLLDELEKELEKIKKDKEARKGV